MGSMLAALQLFASLTTALQMFTESATKIASIINTARAEGRDITDTELEVIQKETDALQDSVIIKLQKAAERQP